MRTFPYLLLLLFFVNTANSQSVILSDAAEASVITCGKGNELYSLYGHTALRIHDPLLHIDKVYNYGTFDFRTKNFGLKFVKGDLQYFVSTASFEDFLIDYQYDKRTVLEQTLALSHEQVQQLFDKLNKTSQSDERFYTYKFIDRNCTTKVLDILNGVLGENTLTKVGNKDISYRSILYPAFDGHFYEQWGTSLFFGTKVDEKADKVFLPIELWESVNAAKLNGRPLLKENKSWLTFEDQPMKPSFWNNPYTYVVLLLLLILLNNDKVTLVYFTILALLGTFFCLSGWYSFHEELKWDYNVLLVNPLLLFIVIFYARRDARKLFASAAACMVCLALYMIIMFNKAHLLILLPMIVTNAVLLGKFVRRYRKGKLFAVKL